MSTFIHPNALCESDHVGDGTRVWASAHVLPGADIGEDCNICDGVFIENDVRVGDRVTVKCGVQLWDGVTLEDDVFVGPNATFTNDRFPRSRHYPESYPATVVGRGASVGANATILPGVKIGAGAMVGAGSVVLHDVPEYAIVVGNPARVTGYVDTRNLMPVDRTGRTGVAAIGTVAGVLHLQLARESSSQGSIVTSDRLPFAPERFFLVSGAPAGEAVEAHAYRTTAQFLVCVAGSVNAVVSDGVDREEYVLDSPGAGLFVPAMIWGSRYKHSNDAVLLVFESRAYDAADAIRDYEEFLALRAEGAMTRA